MTLTPMGTEASGHRSEENEDTQDSVYNYSNTVKKKKNNRGYLISKLSNTGLIVTHHFDVDWHFNACNDKNFQVKYF